jgi:cytidylate kinase
VSRSVITVDGPAASGKSTAARNVASTLNFHHLSSGLLYRAVGWAGLAEGWSDADAGEVADRLGPLEMSLVSEGGGYVVEVDGRRPGPELRTAAVAEAASRLSQLEPVRRRVNELVRLEGTRRDLVCDGRDVGTVVFPGADLKVWLTATPEERARRRLAEEGDDPDPERIREVAERIRARDEADASRELDPLRRPEDALDVDSTDLSPGEVADRIVAEARRRGLA